MGVSQKRSAARKQARPPLTGPPRRDQSNGNDNHGGGGNGDNLPREMACEDVRPLLMKYYEGQLASNPSLLAAVDRHLDECEECNDLLQGFEIGYEALVLAAAMEHDE